MYLLLSLPALKVGHFSYVHPTMYLAAHQESKDTCPSSQNSLTSYTPGIVDHGLLISLYFLSKIFFISLIDLLVIHGFHYG